MLTCLCFTVVAMVISKEKSCIREILNLSTCVNSSTATNTDRKGRRKRRRKMSCVRCHVSGVTRHVSPLTCHLWITPTATATDPPNANSPIMHSRLVCKEPKTKKIQKRKKNQNGKTPRRPRSMPILEITSSTRSLQSNRMAPTHTTDGYQDLETKSAQKADSVKTIFNHNSW